MEDLPFGCEEGLIRGKTIPIHRVFTFTPDKVAVVFEPVLQILRPIPKDLPFGAFAPQENIRKHRILSIKLTISLQIGLRKSATACQHEFNIMFDAKLANWRNYANSLIFYVQTTLLMASKHYVVFARFDPI
jgi:hypothetical protein